MGHIDLDPVGAVIKLLAGRLARRDRPVNDLCALGHVEFRRVALQIVATGTGNGASGDNQTRPGNVAAFDRHLDADVAITGAFGLHVAQRGKALLQCAANRYRGSRRPQCQRIFQDVCIVAPLRRLFSLEEDVSVGINQAG